MCHILRCENVYGGFVDSGIYVMNVRLSRLKSSATLPELSSKRGKHGKEDHCQAIFESHVTFEPAVVEPL